MDWITQTLYWYVHLFVIGVIFFPLTKKLFSKFFDFGYSFSKPLGIILISYAAFILGILKIAPFGQITLYVVLAAFAVLNLYIFIKDKELSDFVQTPAKDWLFILFEEFLFLGSIFFLAYVRGQEPSVHGLEKFMDFGFMNSILKSTAFPPLDMWYSAGPDMNGIEKVAGFPINYYYFGHLTGAMLIQLTGIIPFVGYNLVLATIFAQGMTLAFSLVGNIVHFFQKTFSKKTFDSTLNIVVFGLLGSIILNLAGNLQTIYLFTKGYPNDSPIPFWQILSNFNPLKYWYPNATRFIPFTIHEFPSYSYVVADLHGHVFDIPFVLLTIGILFHLFYSHFIAKEYANTHKKRLKLESKVFSSIPQTIEFVKRVVLSKEGAFSVLLGFLTAVHYMTNAFDGPIYILLSSVILFLIYRVSYTFIVHIFLLLFSYTLFSLPFTAHFALFVTGVGVNCAPSFLFNDQDTTSTVIKLGPFLFEKGNCQRSPIWMLFTLWGFFWMNFGILVLIKLHENTLRFKFSMIVPTIKKLLHPPSNTHTSLKEGEVQRYLDLFMLVLFALGTFLLIIPEFIYVKDIYPAHFRANTMFKLGYQAFMMMSIASVYVIYRIKQLSANISVASRLLALSIVVVYFFIFQEKQPRVTTENIKNLIYPEYLLILPLIFFIAAAIKYRTVKAVMTLISIYVVTNALVLICIYPFFSFPAYYGNLSKTGEQRKAQGLKTNLNGLDWLNDVFPADMEIIGYINTYIKGQPVILEAQGDSYTDYERISANTGIPTIAGWWVHEWLWRGNSEVVGKRIPDVASIYESTDINETKKLLKKYHVRYVVISELERKKYPKLNEQKFNQIGKKIFQSSNGFGALYQVE